MTSSSTSVGLLAQTEDVLAHLPISGTSEYRKDEIIYGQGRASNNIYLVVAGCVGLSHVTQEGREVLLDIIPSDEIFGESAFLGPPRPSEQAVAIKAATIMKWSVSDIEELVEVRPRLAIALLQILARRNAELACRIGSFAGDCVERRLARSLVFLSERLGTTEADGSVSMMPLTHGQLSQYIGTSREIVTHFMGQFRRRGHVSYSRRVIQLRPKELRAVLD